MHPLWLIEKPNICTDKPQASGSFSFFGWIAVDTFSEVENLRVNEPGIRGELALSTKRRPDVEQSLNVKGVGFGGSCPVELLGDLDSFRLAFENQGQTYEIVVPVKWQSGSREELKAEKLKRIKTIALEPVSETESYLNYLTGETKERHGVVHTDNVSSGEYDGLAMNLIYEHPQGLILDCGAGERSKYFANVVNYEIVPYASTDVLGVAEELPFQNEVFDAVLSFAVLEHVKDPFKAAQELKRVLKPGGTLYCQVPFLAPFHGYPDHYYNMTPRGLECVFGDEIDVQALDVLNLGQPVHHLTWFLQLYVAGLPDKVRRRFERMRVSDLLKPGQDYLGEPFVNQLSGEAKRDLGCVNFLYGRKKWKESSS